MSQYHQQYLYQRSISTARQFGALLIALPSAMLRPVARRG